MSVHVKVHGGKRQTSILDAVFLEHAVRPIGHAPHNLDTTDSIGGRSIYRIRILLLAIVKVEPLFESPTHIMPGFAVWVA